MSPAALAVLPSFNPQLESRLAQIPHEILVRITYFISTVDLGNARLTCKALEQGLFNFFSHEFFRKKQFMVTSDSLQALIDISKHPTLSQSLSHVIISCDRPTLDKWAPDRNDEARARLELAVADHMHLLATGRLRDMLVEAFSSLKNLKIVGMRDFNSPSRNRDGLGTQWRSYGSVALEASTQAAVRPFLSHNNDNYPTQLFCAITAALAATHARPESIEVLFRTPICALDDTAFYIPAPLEQSTSSLLAGLHTLHLCLALTHPTKMSPFMYQKFISLAPNLRWLRLNFVSTARQEIEQMASWLALKEGQNPPAMPFYLPAAQLRYLERLDLGSAEIEPQQLVRLVAKFTPTLTSLYLRRVSLVDGHNRSRTTPVNPWVSFLNTLRKLPGSKLRVLDLSLIATTSAASWRAHVWFKAPGSTRTSNNWQCSANLTTMDKAIAQTIEAMTVKWPTIITQATDGMKHGNSMSSAADFIADNSESEDDESEEQEEEEEDDEGDGDGEGEGNANGAD